MFEDAGTAIQLFVQAIGIQDSLGEPTIKDVVSPVSDENRSIRPVAQGRPGAEPLQESLLNRGPEGIDLDGKRDSTTKRVHQLSLIDNDEEPVRCRRDDLFAEQCAPETLDQPQVGIDLVRPINGQIELWMIREGGKRDSERPGMYRCVFGGRNADQSPPFPRLAPSGNVFK